MSNITLDPQSVKPAGLFEESFSEPTINHEQNTKFQLKLSFGSQHMGYLGLNGDEWAILSTDPTTFNTYVDSDGNVYYQIVSGQAKGKWLSISTGAVKR